MPGPGGRPETAPQPLCVFGGGFLGPSARARRVRRILTLAGLPPRLGWPGCDGLVGVWGRTPVAWRGEAVAGRSGARLVRIEDAFLRSVRPGRSGEPPLGLAIDHSGIHYDAGAPGDLQRILARTPLDDAVLLTRAHRGIARLISADLSKYNIHDPSLAPPEAGYVLIIDQVQDDASIRYGQGSQALFDEMLALAQIEYPSARILIRTHPETASGFRRGHYGPGQAGGRVSMCSAPRSPWALLQGAIAVYTVSSQMGFEAILAGHRPHVFGAPFYAGWGLTEDRAPALPAGRGRKLTRAQLFAAAMLLYPTWYDPCRDRLCDFEDVLDTLEAQVRAWREDRAGHVALGMRLWKRGAVQGFFGAHRRLVFAADPGRAAARAAREGRALLVWAGKETRTTMDAAKAAGVPLARVEDGFLRSRGLGAALVPPWSLVRDDLGIYYDPTRESRLERLIAAPPPPGAAARAERLVARLVDAGLSKYNVGQPDARPTAPPGAQPTGARRILVPGQVEDDASILLATREVCSNLALLARTRAENPDATILYKPHPDVEAGLRPGAIAQTDLDTLADGVLRDCDPAAAIGLVDEVWTMTSLLGFEALLRGRAVTCLGMPFYAGWGLTRDLMQAPARRQARPGLAVLAHAVLVAYPRYRDPVSGLPCPAEVIVDRLAQAATGVPAPRLAPGPGLRLLSRIQGVAASYSRWWR